METLWKSEVFTADDFRVFRYQPNPVAGVADNIPENTAFHTNTTLLKEKDPEKWLPKASKRKADNLNEWLQTVRISRVYCLRNTSDSKVQASPTTKTEESFALLLPRVPPPKRPTRFPNIVNSAVLKNLPISQEAFASIVEKLSIHHAFAVIVDRGVPIISRTQSEINGKNCFIYTLRVEHTLKDQSAMTITHFREAPTTSPSFNTPNGGAPPPQKSTTSEMYALILGYKDADSAHLERCLQNCKESIFNPFTLIKAFLAIERGHRFKEVDLKIRNFQDILQNYGRLPFGTDGSGQHQGGGEGSEEDPKNLIELYLDIYMLKIRLMAWSTQIAGLKKYTSDFLSLTTGRQDIDPEEYLQRMVDEYEVKINKCGMVLQGASLAFQLETAHLARLDSARSIRIAEYARADSVRSIQIAELSRLDSLNAMRDGKQMKAIALLTMIFLPGTFIATVLAVPVFDSIKDTASFKPWAWYPILFVPLTAVVLVVYFFWITYYKSKSQKEVDKCEIYKPRGMKAVSLTTVGNV